MLVQSAETVLRALEGAPFLLAFSGGKDSVTMLDIVARAQIPGARVVHFYLAPGIPSRERLLSYYESRYGIKIDRRESWYGATLRTGRKVKQGETFKALREEFGVKYIAEGIKPTDSIIRCALIKRAMAGINHDMGAVYPIYRWYDSAVMAYIRQHKLLLPPEYQANMKHDLSNATLESLEWMKHNLPADYRVILATYPKLADRMIQREMYAEEAR
ncbi:MAG: phosphoadenosine phosphosulfate reductase family protein [Spirochaetes bacterium]|nr:phosphoadenosine phosphosulfate reductase family protein [Spirochaetota bacterium]